MNLDEVIRTGTIDYSAFAAIISEYYSHKYDIVLDNNIAIGRYINLHYTDNPEKNNQIYLTTIRTSTGEGKFCVSEEDIVNIFKKYLDEKGYTLDTINFEENEIKYTYKTKTSDVSIPEPAEIDITYSTKFSYDFLRGMIVNYYKNTQGIELEFPSIDYFERKLKKGNDSYSYPYFSFKDSLGNKVEFDISIEEIEKIIVEHYAKLGESIEIKPNSLLFNNFVNLTYKINKDKIDKKEKVVPTLADTKTLEEEKPNVDFEYPDETIEKEKTAPFKNNPFEGTNADFEYPDDIITKQLEETFKLTEKGPKKELEEQSKETEKENEPKKELDGEPKEPEKENEIPVREEELRRAKREGRRFWIIQRHRALNEAEKKQIVSGICAGLCFLGLSAAIFFNPAEANRVLQDEIKMIYSWEAVVQYFKDIGPLETLLAAGAGTFIATYLRSKKEAKKIQGELEDFWESLEGGKRL